MRNLSNEVAEKFKTHILCSTRFLEIRTIYEIMWKIWWS